MVRLTRSVLNPALGWAQRSAERSQQRACRNAMVATTTLTAARRERAEVERFVSELIARRSPEVGVPAGATSTG